MMNIEPIELKEGAALVIVLQTSEKWGARFGATANNNRALVMAVAELIETTLKLDGYGAGQVVNQGDWGTCVFVAPIIPGCDEGAKIVAKKVIEKTAIAQRAHVAVIEKGRFKKPQEWGLKEFSEFVSVFGEVQKTAGEKLETETREHNEKFANLYRQIEEARREIRKLRSDDQATDEWKDDGKDSADGGAAK